MTTDYHQPYLGQLRQHIGKMKVFVISARAITLNETGELQTETDETVGAQFFPLDQVLDIPYHYQETWADLEPYRSNGRFILK